MPQESFTIYVVDDDAYIRRALKRLLKSAGYNAVTFESAEEFLDIASCHGRGCLILELSLLGMTGLYLQEELVSLGAKYPVISMTAYDNLQRQERAKKAGALACLRKPFDEASLLGAIEMERRD